MVVVAVVDAVVADTVLGPDRALSERKAVDRSRRPRELSRIESVRAAGVNKGALDVPMVDQAETSSGSDGVLST